MLCQECQGEIPNPGPNSPSRGWRGRPALYCSTACRVRAHRRRKRAVAPDPAAKLRQRIADLTAELTSTVAALHTAVSPDRGPLPHTTTGYAAHAAKLATRITRLTAALAKHEQPTSPAPDHPDRAEHPERTP